MNKAIAIVIGLLIADNLYLHYRVERDRNFTVQLVTEVVKETPDISWAAKAERRIGVLESDVDTLQRKANSDNL